MATRTPAVDQQTPQPQRPLPAGNGWLVPLAALGILVALAVATLAATGHLAEAGASASKAMGAIASLSPIFIPMVIAALIPRGERGVGWKLRLPLAIMAGLIALFVSRMWIGGAEVVTGEDVEPAAPIVESTHLLSWLIGLPLGGAVAILFMPRQSPRLLKATTFIIMMVTLFASVALLRVDMGRDYHFNQDFVWMARFGIHYHVAIDGLSLWMVMLTVFIVPVAAYASFGSIKMRIKDWCFALLLLEGAIIGAFVSLDLFLFYVFFELMLVPMYLMIGVWGGTNRIKAAIKFFLYTMFGSVLMLGAILYLGYSYSKLSGGAMSFDYFELQRVLLPRHVQVWLYAAFALAFIIKVPMFPLHTWLPDAHTEAPTGGSIILAAVMLKVGTYGYLRFCLGLFPEASAEFAANLAGVAVLGGILYGALCAWKQDDVKRLVAYSSVAHLGYCMLGIFACTQASLEGSVLQMVNHGVSTGMLFLLVGVIYDRRHTRMVDDFGGLAKPMPLYATIFVIATLASIGLPGTNGFIGEFMVITGTFVSTKLGHFNGIQAVGAAIGVILGALYMLSVVQKMFFGPITKPENKHLPDLNHREILALAAPTVLIFVIGFFPNIFLSQIQGAAARVQSDLQQRVEQNPAPRFYEGPMKLLPARPEAAKQTGSSPKAAAQVPPPSAAPTALAPAAAPSEAK
jgi:NADH-quinone oxidoreductase subunit M